MKNNEVVLQSIGVMRSIMINKGYEAETLNAEFTRLGKTKPPYYIAKGIRTALKLLDTAEEMCVKIFEMLHRIETATRLKTHLDQKLYTADQLENGAGNTYRSDMTEVVAAGFLQGVHAFIISRVTEELSKTQLLILVADKSQISTALPSADELRDHLIALKDLTLNAAHDLAEHGETIEKYNQPNDTDGPEVRSYKEAIAMIQELANTMMNKSVSLINSCIDGIKLIDTLEESFIAEHIEGIVGKSIAAASQAQVAAALVDNVLGSIGA